MVRIHKVFLSGFVAGIIIFGLFVVMRAGNPSPDIPLLNSIADKSVLTREDAQRKHLFWLQLYQGKGLAIRLFDSPALFDSIFPGYCQTLADRKFWRNYFLDFDQAIFSPILMRNGLLSMLNISWLGSIELYNKSGADILLLGNSETYQNIPVGLLRDMLKKNRTESLGDLKIITCGRVHMMPRTAALSTRAMAGGRGKARLVIWGYSIWNAKATKANAETDQKAFSEYIESRRANRWFHLRLGCSFCNAITWDSIIPWKFQRVWDKPEENLNSFPNNLLRNPAALNAFASRIAPAALSESGVKNVCDMTAASIELDEALEAILKVGDKVLVFVTPANPLDSESCDAEIRKMLKSKASIRVAVTTAGWKEYGLGYQDYAWPSRVPGYSHLDNSHLNYSGAMKFTSKIADLAWRLLLLDNRGAALGSHGV